MRGGGSELGGTEACEGGRGKREEPHHHGRGPSCLALHLQSPKGLQRKAGNHWGAMERGQWLEEGEGGINQSKINSGGV